MATTSPISLAVTISTTKAQAKPSSLVTSDAFFHPLRVAPTTAGRSIRARRGEEVIRASGSMKEKALSGLTSAALVAALVVPDVAEAAQPGLSPSLKNFILSILSGGGVLVVILGVVIGVSNFDPVKRK